MDKNKVQKQCEKLLEELGYKKRSEDVENKGYYVINNDELVLSKTNKDESIYNELRNYNQEYVNCFYAAINIVANISNGDKLWENEKEEELKWKELIKCPLGHKSGKGRIGDTRYELGMATKIDKKDDGNLESSGILTISNIDKEKISVETKKNKGQKLDRIKPIIKEMCKHSQECISLHDVFVCDYGPYSVDKEYVTLSKKNGEKLYKSLEKFCELRGKNLGNILNTSEKTQTKEDIADILLKNHQIILQGPPGTGKTRMAKLVAALLVKGENGTDLNEDVEEDLVKFAEYILDGTKVEYKNRINLVQFHPSYGYDDFIMGIRIACEGKNVSFQPRSGAITGIAENAEKHKDDKYILIIDEINRAPLSTVMGELLYALEKRGEEITITSYGDKQERLSIPDNLYIIGTMNTVDRSLNNMDYAMRRRFAFVNIYSEKIKESEHYSFVETYYKNVNDKLIKSSNIVKGIDVEDIKLGPSFFICNQEKYKGREEEYYEYKLNYEIIPLLVEYYKDGYFKKKGRVKYGNEEWIISDLFQDLDKLKKFIRAEKKNENNNREG